MGKARENLEEQDSYLDELKPGTKLLNGQYTVNCFLNSGGFGITYLATNSLDRKVVIKECFPSSFCHRKRNSVQARSDAHLTELKAVVKLFMQEARSLAKLDHPNIVGVHEVFEENHTAYMVLDFVEGRDLLDTLDDPNHGLNGLQIQGILKDVLGAVQYIHDRGILHRDISPDNILLDADMRPVLIDFGAAREEATKQTRVLSALRVVKDGYSPQEFYIQGSPQTPASDLYALGASFYHLVDGELPPNSQARLAAIAAGEEDSYKPLADRVKGYDRKFLLSIDKALAILPKDRVQSADEWLEMMYKSRRRSRVTTTIAPMSSAAAATMDAERKSKMVPLLGSVAALAILAVGGWYFATSQEAEPTQDVAATEQATTVIDETPPELQATAPEAVFELPPASAPTLGWTELQSVTEATRQTAVQDVKNAEASLRTAIEQAAADTATRRQSDIATSELIATQQAEAAEFAIAQAAAAEAAAEAQRLAEIAAAEAAAEAKRLEEIAAAEAAAEAKRLEEIAAAEAAAEAKRLEEIAAAEAAAEAKRLEEIAAAEAAAEAQRLEEIEAAKAALDAPATASDLLLLSNWSVEKPFVTATNSTRIETVASTAPDWARPGTEILAVNGILVSSMAEFDRVLRAFNIPDDAVTQPMELTLLQDGVETTVDWEPAIIQTTQLANGTSFVTRFDGEVWTTAVATIAEDEKELQIGDQIVAYMTTSEPLIERTSLQTILTRELENGNSEFGFAVSREGSMWVAFFTYNGKA